METDSDWTASNTPDTEERSSTRAYQGPYSWKVAHNGNTGRGIVNNGLNVTAGITYYISARIWCVKGVCQMELGNSQWHDANTHFDTTKTGEWELVEGYAICDSTSSVGNIYFRTNTSADTEFYVDDVKLHPVNGNPGVLVNMDAVDFTGDTP